MILRFVTTSEIGNIQYDVMGEKVEIKVIGAAREVISNKAAKNFYPDEFAEIQEWVEAEKARRLADKPDRTFLIKRTHRLSGDYLDEFIWKVEYRYRNGRHLFKAIGQTGGERDMPETGWPNDRPQFKMGSARQARSADGKIKFPLYMVHGEQ